MNTISILLKHFYKHEYYYYCSLSSNSFHSFDFIASLYTSNLHNFHQVSFKIQ